MKTSLFNFLVTLFAASTFCACSSTSTEAPAADIPPAPNVAAPAKRQKAPAGLVVRTAIWGTGTNVVDVTARVVSLLRTEPKGFAARSDWLHIDPRPYKRKALVVLYDYKGAAHTLIATDERIHYDLLVKNANR